MKSKREKHLSFRQPFSKGCGVEGQSPSSSSADDETPLPSKRSGGEEKQFGELFLRGEPYQGVPRS